ncbi:hypothetical protein [Zavarzinella formosa]|uniref:hypothetical protein n=1 Tax=Zavarzinella formosa TaxID=360055 RepID=UPI000315014A|nr:hypothetical protein [Zavarzinella formosa]
MGHVLLGQLPRTREWKQVVGLIRHGAGAAQVAKASIEAAGKGLRMAGDDKGVVESVWLMIRVVMAGRTPDFPEALRQLGLNVSNNPGLIEIMGAMSDSLDAASLTKFRRTDLGEMSQTAVAETISTIIGQKTSSLFGTSTEDVREALGSLGTEKQFSLFAKHYYGRFVNKCLDYFLSKTLAEHVGDGRRFRTLAEQAEFTDAMETHCREASKIVEKYAGEWFCKKRFMTGGKITRKDVENFHSYAMTKLIDELKQGAAGHGK